MSDNLYEIRINATKNMIDDNFNHMLMGIIKIIPYSPDMLHIGYVLQYLEENNLSQVDNPTGCGCCHDTTDNEQWILELWKEKRKPIENQSYECIEYIYNLIIQKNK